MTTNVRPLTNDEIERLLAPPGRQHLDAWESSDDYQQPDGDYDRWLRKRMLATIVDLRDRLRRAT